MSPDMHCAVVFLQRALDCCVDYAWDSLDCAHEEVQPMSKKDGDCGRPHSGCSMCATCHSTLGTNTPSTAKLLIAWAKNMRATTTPHETPSLTLCCQRSYCGVHRRVHEPGHRNRRRIGLHRPALRAKTGAIVPRQSGMLQGRIVRPLRQVAVCPDDEVEGLKVMTHTKPVASAHPGQLRYRLRACRMGAFGLAMLAPSLGSAGRTWTRHVDSQISPLKISTMSNTSSG